MDSFLKLRGVSKRYGKVQALKGISLSLQEDELVVVLGPTGAGKTTLLRTIVGLESPEEGSIIMEGREITHDAPADRYMAMVFQDFSLYPDWTVRRNLEFPLRAPGRRYTKEEIQERVEWAATMLRINHLLGRDSNQLSGGEMQRVTIGRAIVRRPKLFLMDEPLSNLDAKLREELRVEIACLRRELGTPMIYVTHDQAEALSMADRIIVLSNGEILQTGTPEEIYRAPATPEVALQLGQPKINLLPVTRSDGQWVTGNGLALLDVRDSRPERMMLGVRPEDIEPTGGKEVATVEVVEDMGATRILVVNWWGHRIHITVPKSFACGPGDEVYPHIRTERAILWDP